MPDQAGGNNIFSAIVILTLVFMLLGIASAVVQLQAYGKEFPVPPPRAKVTASVPPLATQPSTGGPGLTTGGGPEETKTDGAPPVVPPETEKEGGAEPPEVDLPAIE